MQMPTWDVSGISSVTLFCLCAEDREDSALWLELLRRVGPKVKQFIRGTLRQSMQGMASPLWADVQSGDLQESDLFQNTVLKLAQNDCAAMKRFSGTSEDELLAYLAVITRSVVRDCLRRRRAKKRPPGPLRVQPFAMESDNPVTSSAAVTLPTAERELLALEIRNLSDQNLGALEGETSVRDRLIFRLYFFHDLSLRQIAQCRGINLSKAGVEKVIGRFTERLRRVVAVDVAEARMQ